MLRTSLRSALAIGVLLASLSLGAMTLGAGDAHAQGEPTGLLTGVVTMATAGEALEEGAQVRVIVLSGSEVTSTIEADVVDGRYEVALPIADDTAYVPSIVYGGVSYFAEPTRPTSTAPDSSRDFVVFATSTEVPNLSISETVMTVAGLDRGSGDLALIREDLVVNPSDRVYIGDDGPTLRLPVPEGTTDAAGENPEGEFTLDEGVLTTTTPLRAQGQTSIVSRYLVEYDVAEDRYVLRVTVPVAAERVTLRIPEDYVRRLSVEGAGAFGVDEVVETGAGEPVTLRTVVLQDARPGDSLVVLLDGLALQRASNPLTEMPGSLIGGAGALVVLLLAVGLATRRARTAEADA